MKLVWARGAVEIAFAALVSRHQRAVQAVARSLLYDAADAEDLVDGFDRWIGGVHLLAVRGSEVSWRWNLDTQRLQGALPPRASTVPSPGHPR